MNRVRLLIVEDDALIAADLAALLTDLGYVVCGTCIDARSAMLAIAQHAPDLLLLDINLGDGADGVRIAQEVNARHPIPFLFVTGHTDPGTLARVKQVRPAGFIIKPFDEDDLRTQIEIALARYATGLPTDRQPEQEHRQDFMIGSSLFVRDKGRLVKVLVDHITHAEADGNYVTLHTRDRRYVLTSSLSMIEARIRSQWFMRVHRSFLIDLRRVTGVEEKRLFLGEVVIPVGRTHREELRRKLALER